jgi:hypothetical protein
MNILNPDAAIAIGLPVTDAAVPYEWNGNLGRRRSGRRLRRMNRAPDECGEKKRYA